MGAFDNRVVIVTGGALGMGRTTSFEFAREGAVLVRAVFAGLFLEGDMIVRAAEPEGADRRTPGLAGIPDPRPGLGVKIKRGLRRADFRMGPLRFDRRRATLTLARPCRPH